MVKLIKLIKSLDTKIKILWILSFVVFFTTFDTIMIFERSFASYLVINMMEWVLGIGAFCLGYLIKKVE